jgi:ATP-dependent Lon protease
MSALQGRVFWGGALSGRDINGVQKTVSGLLKLLYPDPEMPVPDEDLEWIVRVAWSPAGASRSNRSGASSPSSATPTSATRSGSTASSSSSRRRSYTATRRSTAIRSPRARSGRSARGRRSGAGPLPNRGVGRTGQRRQDSQPSSAAGLPGERRVGEQNLYARAKELVGDREPRSHEFSMQLRPFDADKSGAGLGLPVLVALVGGCSNAVREAVRLSSAR